MTSIQKVFTDAVAFYKHGQLDLAAQACKAVLKEDHNNFNALNLLAVIGIHQGKYKEAYALMNESVRQRPNMAELHNNLGIVLDRLKRPEEAIASYQRALALKPDYSDALFNLGNAQMGSNRPEAAVASYLRALELRPDSPDVLNNLGNTLMLLKQYEEAIRFYRKALDLKPDHPYARSMLASASRLICDWSEFKETERLLIEHVRLARSVVNPFMFLAWSCDPELQLGCAQYFARHRFGSGPAHIGQYAVHTGRRLRIAYLSADLHDHATANLMAGLFESHDRDQFEVLAFSYGPDDGSAMRQRLKGAFDDFVDVSLMGDQQAAQTIAGLGVQIAIDLKGYTQDSRPEILAYRPAPIQVSYLGYPGTMGADFMDYILVDAFVVPADQQPFYTEKLVHLPDCYQVNDAQREIVAHPMSRTECGLPEGVFVFCCFNKNYKIIPDLFDVWMRLLKAVPDSVLWLLSDHKSVEINLRREAETRGVHPGRLVFAERIQLPLHLARHHLADLFLDTLPYNAHTTASDALWMALPAVTCVGRTFPGRVCGSLLNAIGIPELVTQSLSEYEALALKLATTPELLHGFREKLTLNRSTQPLFDTDRFRRHIESAYSQMWQIRESGVAPKTFAVEL